MIQSLLKRYISNEPLAHPLTRSLAPLTHSLASYCSLHTARFARALLRSLAHSLTHSFPNSWDNGIFLSDFQCVRNHSESQTHRILDHSLIRSLVHSHRTFIHFLRTARFAPALRCAHSFICSLAHSLAPELMEKRFLSMNKMRRFPAVSTHYGLRVCACMWV